MSSSPSALGQRRRPGDNPRCITRSMSVPAATIRAMSGDLERLPAAAAAPGAGPARLAAGLERQRNDGWR